MPTWEAKKTMNWKVKSRGNWNEFAKRFHKTVEDDIAPYMKEAFLRLLAESKENRMNAVEVNLSIRGRRLNKVI